ncbi:thioredoxin-disulfide reductase [bacterium 210917-SL.2.15]|nr:thioredoxin-disulfide reductase [bacterium 210917-SL.2.15]
MSMEHVYDMIIVGGGPGGYTAALYGARAGLDTLILEKLSAGGQMALTDQIDNYPGFEDGIDGFSLGEKMLRGAERFGAQTKMAEVRAVRLSGAVKEIETAVGTLYGRTVILATGATPRALGVAGEKELIGKGISYCASCDGMFYRGKTVVIVGGGNTAAADAILLSRICEKVFVVHRRDTLRATKIYHEPLMKAENISFCWNSTVSELLHEDKLTSVKVRNIHTGEETEIPCDGLFVCIGREPASELVKGQLELDGAGYIVADESTRTSLPGVYAVGDVRTKAFRQVVTAVGDGATAAYYADEYLTQIAQAQEDSALDR